MTASQELVAQIREIEIQLYGKRMELAMAIGQRDDAEFWKREMYAAITARNAAKEMELAG